MTNYEAKIERSPNPPAYRWVVTAREGNGFPKFSADGPAWTRLGAEFAAKRCIRRHKRNGYGFIKTFTVPGA